MEIQLYIEGQEVEINEGFKFSLNNEYETLSDPTLINNAWSKSYEIPFTTNNSNLFGNIFNIERDFVISENERNIGKYFNPSKKAYFDIYYNRGLVMHGYCRLQSVDNVKYVYIVNFFGILGATFYELKQCSFSKKGLESLGEDSLKYLLRNPLTPDLKLTKEIVQRCFMTYNAHTDRVKGDDLYYIGFCADYHGLNEDFDSKTYTDGTDFKTFADYLNTNKNIDYGDTLIGDGLCEQQVRQFRVQHQRAYVWIQGLWEIMQEKSKELAENDPNLYPLELDYRWFNKRNPYYEQFAFLCKNEFPKRDYNTEVNYLTLPIDTAEATYQCENSGDDKIFTFKIETAIQAEEGYTYYLSPYVCMKVGIAGQPYRYLLSNQASSVYGNDSEYNPVGQKYRLVAAVEDGKVVFNCEISDLNLNTLNDRFTISIQWEKYADNDLFLKKNSRGTYFNVPINTAYAYVDGVKTMATNNDYFVTMEDILSPNLNVFDILLNYSKMFGLVFVTDNENKVIRVMQRKDYFDNSKILDWTDKVNFINTYNIKQPSFENKYVNWNFQPADTDLLDSYENAYEEIYGTKKVDTGIEFDDSTKDLYNSIKPLNVYSPLIAPWNSYKNWIVGRDINRYYTTELYIDNCKDNKPANVDYCFGFPQVVGVDRTLGASIGSTDSYVVYITEDCDLEKNTNTFCYHDTSAQALQDKQIEAYYINTFNDFTCYYWSDGGTYRADNFYCLFDRPKEMYRRLSTLETSEMSHPNTIFDCFWKDYISERYDNRNKVVTAEVTLSPVDYSNFQFNNFIKIGNTMYIVNRIIDYTIGDGENTKIELQTVRDIDKYKSGLPSYFDSFEIEPSIIRCVRNQTNYSTSPIVTANIKTTQRLRFTETPPSFIESYRVDGEFPNLVLVLKFKPFDAATIARGTPFIQKGYMKIQAGNTTIDVPIENIYQPTR